MTNVIEMTRARARKVRESYVVEVKRATTGFTGVITPCVTDIADIVMTIWELRHMADMLQHEKDKLDGKTYRYKSWWVYRQRVPIAIGLSFCLGVASTLLIRFRFGDTL